jgi:heme-degrading monooxygenase HmoA
MIVAVFRSRIRPEALDAYNACAQKARKLAERQPGFVSVKSFYADDGEKVSIHIWESAEHLRKWRDHPEHVKIQQRGRKEFYETYSAYVCDKPRYYQFPD